MKQEEKQMRQYLRQIGRQLEVTGTLRERILSDLENDIRAGLEQGETMEKIRDRMGTPEEIGKRFSEELGTDRKPSWIWLPRAGLLLSAAALVIIVLWSLLAGQLLPGMAGANGDSAAIIGGTDSATSISVIGGADGPTSIYLAGRIGGNWTEPWKVILLLLAVFLACGAVCLAAGQKRRNAAALILAVLAVATALGGGILGWLSPDGIGLYLAGGVQNLWFWAGAAGALLVALGVLVFVIAKMMSRKK